LKNTSNSYRGKGSSSYNLDFKTCRKDIADRKVKEYLCIALDNLFAYYPKDRVEAIILIGGMARGEGSVNCHSDGRLRIYSDFDLLVVLKEPKFLQQTQVEFLCFSKELSTRLRQQELCSEIDYEPTLHKRLRNWRPRILYVELQASAKVVWGNPNIMTEIPRLDIKQIPQIDALNLLFNRIQGQLLSLPDFKSLNSNEVESAFYHAGKIFVDLAGAILALVSEYEPTYEMRAHKIADILARDELSWIRNRIPGLVNKVEFWTEFKLEPNLDSVYSAYRLSHENVPLNELGMRIWLEAVDYVKNVWIWASNRYLHPKYRKSIPLSDNIVEIARNYLGRSSLKENYFYWRVFARNPHLDKGMFSYLRMLRLIRLGRPRILANLSGAMLFFSAPAIYNSQNSEIDKGCVVFATKYTPIFIKGRSKEISQQWEKLRRVTVQGWRAIVKGGG
jgi:predicted nucleotidyltransferase